MDTTAVADSVVAVALPRRKGSVALFNPFCPSTTLGQRNLRLDATYDSRHGYVCMYVLYKGKRRQKLQHSRAFLVRVGIAKASQHTLVGVKNHTSDLHRWELLGGATSFGNRLR